MDNFDSRFKVVARPQLALPACSFISRTDDDEWFIDCGIQLDFFGAIYIGKRDMDELAKVAGYLSQEDFADLVADREKLRNDYGDLLDRYNELRGLLDSVLRVAEKHGNNEQSDAVGGGDSSSPSSDDSHDERAAGRRKVADKQPARSNSGGKSGAVSDDAAPVLGL